MPILGFPLLRNAVVVPVLALGLLAGCATPPPATDAEAIAEYNEINDPLEPTNRKIFAFNQGVDKYALKPIAQGYRTVVPEFGRTGIRNFLSNLQEPWSAVNGLLQGEVDVAVRALMRFAMNSTFGLAGVLDIATEGGIPEQREDLGQTLAVWGVGEGPYLVVPFIGPSNPRDFGGNAVQRLADPFDIWMDKEGLDWAIWTRLGLEVVDTREAYLDSLDEVERMSIDQYSTYRTLYRQRRAAEIENVQSGAAGQASADLK